jgi:hypothetical protein
MHRFEVGDWVEVIGGLVAPDMKQGTILRVLPHSERPKRLNEYEVGFGLGRPYITKPNLERSIPRSTRTECFHIKFSFACFENYATEPSGAALVKVVAESFQDRGASIRVCNSDYEVFQRCSGRRRNRRSNSYGDQT